MTAGFVQCEWWRVVFGRLGVLMKIEDLSTLMEMGLLKMEIGLVVVIRLYPRAMLAHRLFRSPTCNGAPFHKSLPMI